MSKKNVRVKDRGHFLASSAQAMRTIVVAFARARLAKRRGGGAQEVTLDSMISVAQFGGENEVAAVHEALDELAMIDGRLAKSSKCENFGALADAEIAEVMDVSKRDFAGVPIVAASVLSADRFGH